MSELTILEVNGQTGEATQRELTSDELKELKIMQTQAKAAEAEAKAKAEARASALAKLAELGLTEEEIAAL